MTRRHNPDPHDPAWWISWWWMLDEYPLGEIIGYSHDGPIVRSHPLVYAECQGPDDPCCGRCRFSVHGCGKPPKPPRPPRPW